MYKIFTDLALQPEALDILRRCAAGHELVFADKPVTSVLAKAECDPKLLSAEIIFGQPDPSSIAEAKNIKWIHVSTSGITRYDNPEFRELLRRKNIVFTNSASVYNEACADHLLGFMLAESRMTASALDQRIEVGSPEWHTLRSRCVPLRASTAVIIGYGAIGRRLVELLAPYEMRIFAYRRRARGDENVPMVSRDELTRVLAEEADHVVNILPESAETRGFFNAALFAIMKPGAVFYNIGRGSTVDQAALLDALGSGRVKSAWLDVTEPEPLPIGHPLLAAPNCHITPHIGGGHRGEAVTLVRHFARNFERFVEERPLVDRVFSTESGKE